MGALCCVLVSLISGEEVFFMVVKETNIFAIKLWRAVELKSRTQRNSRTSISVLLKAGQKFSETNVFLPSPTLVFFLKTGWKFSCAFFYHLREGSRGICQQPISSHIFPAFGSLGLLFFCPVTSQKCTALCWGGNPGWTLSHWWFELFSHGAFSHVVSTECVNKFACFSLGKSVFCYRSLSPPQIDEGQGNTIYFLLFTGTPIASLTLDGCLVLEKVSLGNHC